MKIGGKREKFDKIFRFKLRQTKRKKFKVSRMLIINLKTRHSIKPTVIENI